MAYPAYPQERASRETRLSGRQLDRSTNGRPRVRAFYAAPKKEFTVVHPVLTTAEKEALEAFIAANASNAFDFRWGTDGVTYSVLLGQVEPDYLQVAVGRWSVTVNLVQA